MASLANVFELLGDNENDDIQQLAAKAPPAAKPAEKPAQAPKTDVKPAAKSEAPAAQGGRGGRGGDRGRGIRGGRGGRGGRFDQNGGAVEEPVGEDGRGDGGRSRRGGRGRGRGRGEGRPPKREYERHDGTGRGHELTKRGGTGKGNWGVEGEEVQEVPDNKPAEVEGEVPPAAAPAAEGAEGEAPATEETPAPEPEPEEKEITLDDYEKQLAERQAALMKQAEAKTVSLDEFKGMKAFTRKDAEEVVPGLELTKKKEQKPKEEKSKDDKPKKQVIETGFRIADEASAPRGGRGGRGRGDRPFSGRGDRPPREGGRGGRGGRGEGRGPRAPGGRGASIAIDDQNAFPSLA